MKKEKYLIKQVKENEYCIKVNFHTFENVKWYQYDGRMSANFINIGLFMLGYALCFRKIHSVVDFLIAATPLVVAILCCFLTVKTGISGKTTLSINRDRKTVKLESEHQESAIFVFSFDKCSAYMKGDKLVISGIPTEVSEKGLPANTFVRLYFTLNDRKNAKQLLKIVKKYF